MKSPVPGFHPAALGSVPAGSDWYDSTWNAPPRSRVSRKTDGSRPVAVQQLREKTYSVSFVASYARPPKESERLVPAGVPTPPTGSALVKSAVGIARRSASVDASTSYAFVVSTSHSALSVGMYAEPSWPFAVVTVPANGAVVYARLTDNDGIPASTPAEADTTGTTVRAIATVDTADRTRRTLRFTDPLPYHRPKEDQECILRFS